MKYLKMLFLLVMIIVVLPIAVLLFVPQPTPEIVTVGKYQTIGVKLEETEFEGRKATSVEYVSKGFYEYSGLAKMIFGIKGGAQNSVALVSGSQFTNGMIEVDIAATLLKDASSFARGFSGIAFRASEDLQSYEAVYLRPANGRVDDPVRRVHALQYISHPDFHFNVLRKNFPGVYETGADIGLNEWNKLRIEVDGANAVVSVNGVQLLEVKDLKLGADRAGGVALWVNPGTKAYFANLVITPK